MRQAATSIARQLHTTKSQSFCASSLPETVCWRCRNRPFLTAGAQLVPTKRRFTTTPRRRTETIKSEETYYDYFRDALPQGPPPQGPFAIDTKALRKQFLQMQASAHPDRHAGEMKRRAEGLSARINEAYKTLSDPLLRTQYLLSLRGIDTAEDETAKVEDQDLLMQVLESQEEIENAEKERDLRALEETNNVRLEECVGRLERAFEGDDIETAKREAVRLRYWTNIQQGIREWEPGKEIRLVH